MKAIRHIPHDSMVIPRAYRDQFSMTDEQLTEELLRMTDRHTLALFGSNNASDLVFPVSRLLVDVERFEEDTQEPMAAQGMGVLYSRTHDQKPLRRQLAPVERDELLSRYYRPHHKRLERKVEAALKDKGRALIVDCHSFPSCRLPYEIGREDGGRPEICIGTDAFHTPKQLWMGGCTYFDEVGLTVGLDTPFAGAITPLKFYGKDRRVMSIMIEVRRDLYMDEETGEVSPRFDSIRHKVQEAIRNLQGLCEIAS